MGMSKGMSERKGQCPFKISKYICRYGQYCIEELQKHSDSMPSEMNDCSVAQRQLNGNPWKTERQVKWVYDDKGFIFGTHPVPVSGVK